MGLRLKLQPNRLLVEEIKAVSSKERLLSVIHKIAKHSATVFVDPVHKIEIPLPNKWWDYEMEIEMDAK